MRENYTYVIVSSSPKNIKLLMISSPSEYQSCNLTDEL